MIPLNCQINIPNAQMSSISGMIFYYKPMIKLEEYSYIEGCDDYNITYVSAKYIPCLNNNIISNGSILNGKNNIKL
jgi:hypothetical protein